MPPLPSVPDVIKVEHLFTVGGDVNVQTRWHLGYTGGAPSNANCTAFAVSMQTAAAANFPALMDTNTSLQGVVVTDLSSPSGGSGDSLSGHAGTRTGELLAAGVAVLCHQPIARRYRGGKPRTYWPFLTAADMVTRQLWASAATTAVAGALETYLAAIESLSEGTTTLTGLVSVSYYEGFTPVTNPITGRTKDVAKLRTGGPVVDVITSLSIGAAPASQRRRN